MEIRAIKKGISLEIKEGCDKSFNVVADREMIQQVLNNLVTNSIKYGKERRPHPGRIIRYGETISLWKFLTMGSVLTNNI